MKLSKLREIVDDRGAWRVTAYRVPESYTIQHRTTTKVLVGMTGTEIVWNMTIAELSLNVMKLNNTVVKIKVQRKSHTINEKIVLKLKSN